MSETLPETAAPTLLDFDMNGLAAFGALLAGSPYKSFEQAVASLTIFTHPVTVKQTFCRPVLRIIRNAARRGMIENMNGVLVGLDDNKAPTDVFLWCNGLARRPVEIQFNHIYADSQNADNYACLANICATPSFLAKLTDTHAAIRALLKFRVFELYGWYPSGAEIPNMPNGYTNLRWAPPLPPVLNVAEQFEIAMARRPKDRTTLFAQRLGYVFNGFRPMQ